MPRPAVPRDERAPRKLIGIIRPERDRIRMDGRDVQLAGKRDDQARIDSAGEKGADLSRVRQAPPHGFLQARPQVLPQRILVHVLLRPLLRQRPVPAVDDIAASELQGLSRQQFPDSGHERFGPRNVPVAQIAGDGAQIDLSLDQACLEQGGHCRSKSKTATRELAIEQGALSDGIARETQRAFGRHPGCGVSTANVTDPLLKGRSLPLLGPRDRFTLQPAGIPVRDRLLALSRDIQRTRPPAPRACASLRNAAGSATPIKPPMRPTGREPRAGKSRCPTANSLLGPMS